MAERRTVGIGRVSAGFSPQGSGCVQGRGGNLPYHQGLEFIFTAVFSYCGLLKASNALVS